MSSRWLGSRSKWLPSRMINCDIWNLFDWWLRIIQWVFGIVTIGLKLRNILNYSMNSLHSPKNARVPPEVNYFRSINTKSCWTALKWRVLYISSIRDSISEHLRSQINLKMLDQLIRSSSKSHKGQFNIYVYPIFAILMSIDHYEGSLMETWILGTSY